jgi:hypothetical protein
VAQNSKFTSIAGWQTREQILSKYNIQLKSPDQDLIDLIWTNDRPSKPNSEIEIHDVKYSGILNYFLICININIFDRI